MKFLKKYSQLFETKLQKVLYHGSPHVFKEFANRTMFFAETEKFAEDYASQKSQDYAMDSEPNVYEVLVTCDILDINNESDFKKLRDALPDKVEYSYNNFGFSREENKDEILLNMKGFYTNEPLEDIKDVKIGDEIPNPQYKQEKFTVYKIDDDYVYTYDKKDYYYFLQNVFPTNDVNYNIDKELRDKFKPINDYVRSYIKEIKNGGYISNNDVKIYSYAFLNKGTNQTWLKGYDIGDIPKKNQREFDKLYKQVEKDIFDFVIERRYPKKFNRKTQINKLIDTWRYYENITVHDTIVNLGYGGYISKEDNVNTYAIFNPKKDTKILSYQFPSGRKFKNWSDWKNYLEFDKYIAHNLTKEKIYGLNRWDTYKLYRKKVSKEEAVELLSK